MNEQDFKDYPTRSEENAQLQAKLAETKAELERLKAENKALIEHGQKFFDPMEMSQENAQLKRELAAISKHMDACRALLNVPNDETLYVALEEMKDFDDKHREHIATLKREKEELCLAIDPDCQHGPESDKIADYAKHLRNALKEIAECEQLSTNGACLMNQKAIRALSQNEQSSDRLP